jgi:hypothetical protein
MHTTTGKSLAALRHSTRRESILSPELTAALRDLAAAEDINFNTLVTLLIRDGLEHRLAAERRHAA